MDAGSLCVGDRFPSCLSELLRNVGPTRQPALLEDKLLYTFEFPSSLHPDVNVEIGNEPCTGQYSAVEIDRSFDVRIVDVSKVVSSSDLPVQDGYYARLVRLVAFHTTSRDSMRVERERNSVGEH